MTIDECVAVLEPAGQAPGHRFEKGGLSVNVLCPNKQCSNEDSAHCMFRDCPFVFDLDRTGIDPVFEAHGIVSTDFAPSFDDLRQFDDALVLHISSPIGIGVGIRRGPTA